MLHGNRNAEVRTQRIIGPDTHVRERATSRNELLTNLLMAEIELQTIARAKPVVRPSLRALSTATDPTADQVSIVCITATPSSVLIKRTRQLSVSDCSSGYVGVNALGAQVQ